MGPPLAVQPLHAVVCGQERQLSSRTPGKLRQAPRVHLPDSTTSLSDPPPPRSRDWGTAALVPTLQREPPNETLNRLLLPREEGSAGRATLTLVRWRDGDHLGCELLVKIPGVRLRRDLRLEGRAELQKGGAGYQPCSTLPSTPGPGHSSPPRRQACGWAFPCLGALGNLALQGPTCGATHLTLGPGHQSGQAASSCRGPTMTQDSRATLKGQAHGREQGPPCAPPWPGVRTAWELVATSRLGLGQGWHHSPQEAGPWLERGKVREPRLREKSSWLHVACRGRVRCQQGGSRLEERHLACLGTTFLGL